MKKIFINIFLFLFIMSPAVSVLGQPHGPDRMPYGRYCSGSRWGWYGAKNSVKTADEARKILEEYFKGRSLSIGPIREKGCFFEAEVKDKKDLLIDIVIVDKRTGRIRSIY